MGNTRITELRNDEWVIPLRPPFHWTTGHGGSQGDYLAGDATDKLAAYESIGEPEEIERLKRRFDDVAKQVELDGRGIRISALRSNTGDALQDLVSEIYDKAFGDGYRYAIDRLQLIHDSGLFFGELDPMKDFCGRT